jgi:hypothetical protein
MITVTVTDKRPGRDPNKYTLSMPDNTTVAAFLGVVEDGSEDANDRIVIDGDKKVLPLGAILEDGDTVIVA